MDHTELAHNASEAAMMLFRFAKPSLTVDEPIAVLERAERCVLAALRLYVARIRHPDEDAIPAWWRREGSSCRRAPDMRAVGPRRRIAARIAAPA